jgi:hypothetical protein
MSLAFGDRGLNHPDQTQTSQIKKDHYTKIALDLSDGPPHARRTNLSDAPPAGPLRATISLVSAKCDVAF